MYMDQRTKANTKPKNQKTKKTKTLKRLFGLASKNVFFDFHFVFFWLWNAKAEKTLCVLFFWRFMVGENHQKPKKTQSKHKTKNQKTKTLKRLFGLASKHVFLVFILFFLFFWRFMVWRKSPKTQKTQSKHKTKNQKNQNFGETFWFSLKQCFFWFSFCFFLLALKCKSRKKHCVFLFFWRFMVGENHQKPKNTKQTQNQKPKKPKLWRDFLV